MGNVWPLIPLQIDPPDHLKYRKLLDPLFAPREVDELEDEVRALTNELIDAFVDDGQVEFNAAFAVPLPCTVFLALLGPPRTTSSRVPRASRTTSSARRGMANREAGPSTSAATAQRDLRVLRAGDRRAARRAARRPHHAPRRRPSSTATA